MYWNDHDMNGWNWFAMSISILLFWALLVAIGVLLYRTLTRAPTAPHPPASGPTSASADTAERLLAERFARGEIDEEEYRRRIAVLRADGPGLAKT